MTYDANDCLVKEHHTIPGGSREVIRAYDKDSRETSVTCGSAKVEKAFDELGRLSSIKRNGGKHVTEFTYGAAPDGGATGRVASIKTAVRPSLMGMMPVVMSHRRPEAERPTVTSMMPRDS